LLFSSLCSLPNNFPILFPLFSSKHMDRMLCAESFGCREKQVVVPAFQELIDLLILGKNRKWMTVIQLVIVTVTRTDSVDHTSFLLILPLST
jgi:hypothetical protein